VDKIILIYIAIVIFDKWIIHIDGWGWFLFLTFLFCLNYSIKID